MLMFLFFFFNDTATTEIYTLSLHDALPISLLCAILIVVAALTDSLDGRIARATNTTSPFGAEFDSMADVISFGDRKSTRLNSSHSQISYAVFCLKKKKEQRKPRQTQNCIPH